MVAGILIPSLISLFVKRKNKRIVSILTKINMKKQNKKQTPDRTKAVAAKIKRSKDTEKQFKDLNAGFSSMAKYFDAITKKIDAFGKRMEILEKTCTSSSKTLEANKRQKESE